MSDINSQNLSGSVMVVGAGIAGIQASLDLANSGYLVYLVEQKSAIGGIMAQLDKTFPTNDCSMCIVSPKLVECGKHINIDLLMMTDILGVSGEAGNFKVKILERPRFIDMNKCTACGECSKACPIDVSNRFDEGLRDRKAAFKLYPQAMPSAFAIDKRGTAPCKATCPAHVSIQGYIALINKGKYREALELFKEAHPFPAICGRVCHHPCEKICTRGDLDESLAIQYLHRFIADEDLKNETPYVPGITEKRNEKIAIVGAGPAGLAAAYFLALQGYSITVFEKLPVAGGMMAVGIPAYRLPRDILNAEIRTIQAMGVEIKTGVTFGMDITLNSLKDEGFKAVFLATGLHLSRKLNVEGEDQAGVLKGVDFLRDAALGVKVSVGRKCIVIGGGNVAVDVALTAKRVGADDVTLVCLEKRHEMPAWDYEIAEALEEGVKIVNSLGPKRFLGKDGQATGVEFMRCTSVFDENKAFNPRYDENDLTALDAETVIVAIGQAADLSFAEKEGIITRRGGLENDPMTHQTPVEGLFIGGDVSYGPKSVVEAVESGKKAAESIHRYINGLDIKKGREEDWSYLKPDIEGEEKRHRISMRSSSLDTREENFNEIALGFSVDESRNEADRCLKCGICSECYQCVDACLAGAVNHNMLPVERTVDVGAIVLAPGFTPFDPTAFDTYNYSSHPNVVTSMEFERILSASGPYEGHLIRPSDHREPKKIAWIQCVGSRDINRCDHSYCSSVCCMYAIKEAVIAKEHSHDPLEAAIFYMDMRTYGKEFERYYVRAEQEKGVRFVRSRIHSVTPVEDDSLLIRYVTETGEIGEEIFDMVVLSVGLSPNSDIVELAETLGVELNEHKYAETTTFDPVSTNKNGIFICGVFQGPKDIPQSVMEASAAAAVSGQILAPARGTQTRTKVLPPEIDFSGQEPRIGVFVCNCGINIGGVADVPAVRDYAKTLPNVVHVEDNLFTCSQDTQDKMKNVIKEKGINRVVVASCSPRTHEPLFQDTIRDAGLNKFLFEMANIRDQNTWVHMNEPAKATSKAKELVRMAVAKAQLIEPLQMMTLDIKHSILVVGGGVAGMEAAIGAAEQGFEVYLVERNPELGGIAARLRSTWKGEDIGEYLKDLIQRVKGHPLIRTFLETTVKETSGIIGNFRTRLVSTKDGSSDTVLDHGAVILAPGGQEYRPTEYLYGKHPDVLTHLDLDQAIMSGDERIAGAGCAVFIQCVGSRTTERQYCSRICCTHSLESALKLKELNPDMNVYILYRDIRSYGFREDIYIKARERGVIFIRYDLDHLPGVTSEDDGALRVKVRDHVLGRDMLITPRLLILASAILPNDNKKLCELFKIPVNADGFLIEAHMKLRPVDFASEGMFMAGLAHYPKPLDETIAQAKAAVARAVTIVSKKGIEVGGVVASVDPDKCGVCVTCVRTCPYSVPRIGAEGYAVIDPASCRGCGACVAECPGKAITLYSFTDRQIMAKAGALLEAA
jgi:heterodisulfide reductase subunit A-like polyferredoxin